jgi:nicotinamidase/pyrazinamidase
MNTADSHYINSAEIDKFPDMVNTFPEHCMAGTDGAEYIKETEPEGPTIFDWDKECQFSSETLDLKEHRNLILRKDAFDIFSGSPYTEKVLKVLKPEVVFVYGVTTNICVNHAVIGLAKRINEVYVINDAIKELPGIPLPFNHWEKIKVKRIDSEEFFNMFN